MSDAIDILKRAGRKMAATAPQASAVKLPHEMTLAEFSKQCKPEYGFQRYTSEDRANRAASFRLGHRQQAAIGEKFYGVPQCPGVCFPTPKDAKRAAHRKLIEQAIEDGKYVPPEAREGHYGLPEVEQPAAP